MFSTGMDVKVINTGSIEEALEMSREIRQESGVDAYIIELGINDLKHHQSHEVISRLNDLMTEIRSWAPRALILVSPPVTTRDKTSFLSTQVRHFRNLLDEFIRKLKLVDKDVMLVYNSAFLATPDSAGHYDCLFQQDDPTGIHLSDYGISRLCAYLKRSLFAVWNIPFTKKQESR